MGAAEAAAAAVTERLTARAVPGHVLEGALADQHRSLGGTCDNMTPVCGAICFQFVKVRVRACVVCGVCDMAWHVWT